MAGRPGQSFQPARPATPALFYKGFRWAAVVSLIMLLAGAGWVGGKEHLLYRTYRTGAGETKNLLLADHSRVTLNANTSLKVSRNWFSGDRREVWLTGEAFFNIQKTPDRQRFTVHTATLTVEVLGTKFNVTDRRRKTRVVLQEGKVKVTSAILPAAPFHAQRRLRRTLAPQQPDQENCKDEHYGTAGTTHL